jgi:hypothetical protein
VDSPAGAPALEFFKAMKTRRRQQKRAELRAFRKTADKTRKKNGSCLCGDQVLKFDSRAAADLYKEPFLICGECGREKQRIKMFRAADGLLRSRDVIKALGSGE